MIAAGTLMRSVVLVIALAGFALPSRANGPVMDYASVLTNTVVMPGDSMSLVPGTAPLSPGYFNAAFVTGTVTAVLTRKGSTEPLHTYSYTVQPLKGVVGSLRMAGYDFAPLSTFGEGDFTLIFHAQGTPMTAMHFSLTTRKSGDDFNPVTETVLEGDWSDWAMLRIPFGDGDRDDTKAGHAIQLVHWTRDADRGTVTAEVRLDGELVAEGSEDFSGKNATWPRGEYDLVVPEGLRNDRFEVTDLLARDGTYDVVFKKDETVLSTFQFEVKDGKEVYHPRQAAEHQPRTEYLIPRQYELSSGNASVVYGYDVVWMRALSAK